MKKKIFLSFLFVLTVLSIVYWDLIDYGISQAKGQLKIVNNAKPIEDWLSDPTYPDSLKSKINLVKEIRQFAFDSLGINYSENYTSMYDQQGKSVMFVVSACEPFELTPKKFSFPIVGSFSYKGFFEEERAKNEEKLLKEQGLDTNIRTAGGWSTLGWFKDPILSEMLNRSDGYLAETIIHELTHGTLFVKDSLKFNENLASFIGWHGSKRFLEMKYGEHSDEYQNYVHHWKDRRIYVNHVLQGALSLDSLYKTFDDSYSNEKKKQLKLSMIDEIIESVDTLSLSNKEKYKEYLGTLNINNTFFMSYIRYNGEVEILENELAIKYDNDIKKMLLDYKSKYPSL